jgi:hypothetical protein
VVIRERERQSLYIYIGSYSDQVIHIDKDDLCQRPHIIYLNKGVRVIVFTATFNNISFISWWYWNKGLIVVLYSIYTVTHLTVRKIRIHNK